MCGITGFYSSHIDSFAEALGSRVARMVDTLHHRGPDDAGVWADHDAGVAIAHRRLSILDLSPAGHQPIKGIPDIAKAAELAINAKTSGSLSLS